jgi:hypothetical protein
MIRTKRIDYFWEFRAEGTIVQANVVRGCGAPIDCSSLTLCRLKVEHVCEV